MRFNMPSITVPVLNMKAHSETEVFGGAVWLALHAAFKRDRPLVSLHEWLTPALETQQYLFISDEIDGQHRPVAFMNWGNLDSERESRYVDSPDFPLTVDAWRSGDRMWIFDFLTPFGHARAFTRLAQEIFSSHCFRSLDHHGAQRGLRVRKFRGNKVTSEQEKQWWSQRPILAFRRGNRSQGL